MITDLRFAYRQLIKYPWFSAVAILVLGLGIGANTAIFSIINALLFKPLAIPEPEKIVRLHSRSMNPEGGFRSFSYPNFLDLKSQSGVFRNLTAFTVAMVGVSEGDQTRRVFAMQVAANYFQTFGVRLAKGREFLPEEESPDSGIPVAIASYSHWKKHGFDPELLGKTIKINGRDFQIVGITPEGFAGFSALLNSEFYLPLGVQHWMANDFMNQQGRTLKDRSHHALMLVGRLKDDFGLKQAQNLMEPLAAQLRTAYPEENKDQTIVLSRPSRLSLNVTPSNDAQMAGGAALLFPMSGVVLLIAALNLANMLLARGAARQKEFAIRAALGGTRLQIVRQLILEALLLSLAGGVFALVLASWTGQVLGNVFASKIPFATLIVNAGPDMRVLAATFAFCLLATLAASIIPATRLSRVDIMQDLKEQSSEAGQGRWSRTFLAPRHLLVTAQLALSFVLLVAAALFYRGATRAADANPGFKLEQGVLVEMDGALAGFDSTRSLQAYHAVLEKVRGLPGVDSASLASSVPFGLFSDGRSIGRPGTRQAQQEGNLSPDQQPIYANYTIISADYFQSLGASMLRGREFSTLENAGGGSQVAILNETAAKRLWPEGDAIGRTLEILDGGKRGTPVVVEVVGIAPSFRAAIGDTEPSPYLYVPIGQAFQSTCNLHVRSSKADEAAEKALVPAVRSAIKEVDPQLPVLAIHTLRSFHNDGFVLWIFRAGARMLMAFAFVALVLAAVGVYGVKAFMVERRTREIGIRMALGASEAQVIWMILRNGLGLVIQGLTIGALLAVGAGYVLRSVLFGVSATDPLSFGLALVVLISAAFIASYLPAKKAARVDPLRALRAE